MFDTHVFDQIIDNGIAVDSFPKDFSYYITHVQKNEIEAINNPTKLERKKRLLGLISDSKFKVIPTESFALGVSVLGEAKLGNGGYIEKLRDGNMKYTKDALIGEVVLKNGFTLLTNDELLASRVKSLGGKTLSTIEFFEKIENE
jgi:rRNA-processing protein FCF1